MSLFLTMGIIEMNAPKCFHPGCKTNDTLFRQNEKGKPAVWACSTHITAPIPEEVKEIVSIIENVEKQNG